MLVISHSSPRALKGIVATATHNRAMNAHVFLYMTRAASSCRSTDQQQMPLRDAETSVAQVLFKRSLFHHGQRVTRAAATAGVSDEDAAFDKIGNVAQGRVG